MEFFLQGVFVITAFFSLIFIGYLLVVGMLLELNILEFEDIPYTMKFLDGDLFKKNKNK